MSNMSITRNWWALVVRGILAILFGILILALPGIALSSLLFVIGFYFIVDGIVAIVGAFTHRDAYPHWWLTLIEGIISVAAGGLTIVYPGLTAFTLLYIVAFWAILTGVMEILAAVRLREVIHNEWLLILTGMVSLLFGIFILIQPGPGILAILGLIAGYSIFFGVLLVMLGLRLRTWTSTSGGTRQTSSLA